MSPILPAILAGVGGLYVALERFRKTSHGGNPWSVDGMLGAALIMGHVETVAKMTGAEWNSVFRAESIQRAIYDAKRGNPAQWAVVQAGAQKRGMSTEAYVEMLAKQGRHLRGLAADFSKKGTPTSVLAPQIFDLAKRGLIGKVKKVLDERDHVHVEWYAPWEMSKAPTLESL